MLSRAILPLRAPARTIAAIVAAVALALPAGVFAQNGPARVDYDLVAHLIDRDTFNSMPPELAQSLVTLAYADRTGYEITAVPCFKEGTSPAIVDAFHKAIETNPVSRYQHGGFARWSTTATDGAGVGAQGTPITVTYSFVPDGTTIPNELGFAAGSSVLFNRMNLLYGSTAVWQPLFRESFERWGELNGVTYVFEPNDDGGPTSGGAGVLGVRGDIRIGMKTLDGANNVLAYNNGPNNGDMVFDSGDAIAANFGDPLFFENVTMHEHGHGMGMAHVCPVSQTKLMEPFVSLAYHSARHDDMRSSQRHYGDDLENNDSQGTATPLGTRLLYLTFEGDAIGLTPPTGFTQVAGANLSGGSATGGENWQVGTIASSTSANLSFAGNATRFAYINDDREAAQNGGEDLALRFGTTDTSAFTSLRVNFNYRINQQFGIGLAEVHARNGGAWTKVYNLLGDSQGWQSASIDLTPFIGANTQFAFRYNDENDWAEGIAVDNIELVGNGRGLNVENVSIDDNSDVDWHSITVASNQTLDVTVTPIGFTYLDEAQTAPCTATTNTNSLTIHDLSVEVRDSVGVLATGAVNGAGLPETIAGVPITPGGGPYFIRVFPASATNDVQLYNMNVTLTPAGGFPNADLAITKTDGLATADPGDPHAYFIVVTNNGPASADGATVSDFLPTRLQSPTWTVAYGGGAAGPAGGSGDVNFAITTLPVGGTATITVSSTLNPAIMGGTLTNTANVSVPLGVVDPNPSDNASTDMTAITGVAGPNDIEEFNAFVGMSGAAPPDSPNDTGTTFTHLDFGGGTTTTTKGFAVDTVRSRNGRGLEFDGPEDTAMIMLNEFNNAEYTTNSHQIAFCFRFSNNTGQAAGSRTQMFSALNQGASNLAYMIRCGLDTGSVLGAGITVPVGGGGVGSTGSVPLQPWKWHTCVIQYTSASVADATTLDAAIRVWFNPTSAADAPQIDIAPGVMGSEFGAGPLGSYAFGALVFAAANGPTVWMDSIATWDGFGTPGVNSLQEALDFLDAKAPDFGCDGPWINEIHYDDTGADANEGFEIAGPAGTSLTGWSVVRYTAAAAVGGTTALSGTIPNLGGTGFGTLTFAQAGLADGPGALALVNPSATVAFSGGVRQFLSWEGTMTPGAGAASGLTSLNIEVTEPATGADTNSLQLTGGPSTNYRDFFWNGPVARTPNAINAGQTFGTCATPPTVMMASAAPNPTNTSPIPVSVTFSEDVTGFVAGDIVAGNGTVGNFAGSGMAYTFDLTPTGQGLVTADIAASVATGSVSGLGNTAAAQFSRTFDSVGPTTTIASAAPNPTNTSPIACTVTFTEAVTGFTAGDITPTNGTVGGFAGAGANYTFNLTPTGQGLVSAVINAGVCNDAATNGNQLSNTFSRTFDSVSPTLSLTSAAFDPTNTSPISIIATFSESVTGFVAGDIAPTNATVSNFAGSGANYTFDLTPLGQGAVQATVALGAAMDSAGNPSIGNTIVRTFDSVGPTTTIASAAPNPTNGSPIACTVTFSEPVFSFVAGGIAPTNGTVSNFAGSGANYTFDLTPAGQGLVSAVINAGVCVDAATNPNLASNTLSRTFDSVSPTPTIASAAPDPTNGSPIACTVTFTEAVTGFTAGDITPTNGTVGGFAGAGANYSFNLTPTGQGLVSAVINAGVCADSATNPNLASNTLSRTFDSVGPTPTIASAAPDPTNGSPIACTVTFTEAVTGFTAGDITPTNGTVGGFAGAGANYSFNLTPTGQGLVSAVINAGVCNDAATNPNLASNTLSRTFDSVGPTPTIASAAPNPTNGSPIACAVTFTESVTGFTAGDIAPTNGSVSNFAGTGANYTFDLTPAGQGLVSAVINAGVCADAATNPNLASNTLSRTFDSVNPTVAMSSAAPDPTGVSPIPVTVTFSESVTGFTAGDIAPGNATVNNFAGAGANYTFDLVPSSMGAVTADIAAGVCNDAAGNPNSAAAQFSRLFNGTNPTVVMTSAAPDPTNGSPIPVAVMFSEAVTGFDGLDIAPGNGSVGNFAGSGANYTFDLTPSGQGAVTADIAAAAAVSTMSGFANLAAPQFSRTFDTVAPTVATVVPSTTGPTNAASVSFTVTFSEPVAGFDGAADLLISHSGTNNGGATISGGPTVYTVDVTGLTGTGSFTLAVSTISDVLDLAGNPLVASAVSPSVFIDRDAPTIVSIVPSTTGPTNAATVSFTVTFSEGVVNFDALADLVVNHTGTSSSGATVTGGPAVYNVDVTGLAGDGSFTLAVSTATGVADGVGNLLGASPTSATVVVDRINPTVLDLTVQSALVIDIRFDEQMGAGTLNPANYAITGPGAGSMNANPDMVMADPMRFGAPQTFRLTWLAGSPVNGGAITVTATNVFDSAGNPVSLAANFATSTAVPVEISGFELE